MGLLGSNQPRCPANQHCSEWAKNYMKYCLCSRKDWISLILGLVSVISWGVAEIPQIITNCKEKSADGLAVGFLLTWIIGDFLNLFGCLLEPATLPTQYYTAVLYLVTTLILSGQSIYYGHIYHHRTSKRQCNEIEETDKERRWSHDGSKKFEANHNKWEDLRVSAISESTPCLPIPAADDSTATEYYMSARSLSSSHTPTVSFFHHVQRTTKSLHDQNSVQEPLLGEDVPRRPAPASETKNMLCVVFALAFFLCTYSVQLEKLNNSHGDLDKPRGVVMQVGRKLLQVSGSLVEGTVDTESNGTGTLLGWGMAAIYMGGRLPQICLNIRRGNVQGLNPLMFIFALVGNSTYVASILVSSTNWSKIKPNLPWVVEASGCVMLDTFILIQFIYFRYLKRGGIGTKHGDSDDCHLHD